MRKAQRSSVTLASNFGDMKDYYNGVDIGFNARWGRGAFAGGGVSVGRQVADYCDAQRPSRPDAAASPSAHSQRRQPISAQRRVL